MIMIRRYSATMPSLPRNDRPSEIFQDLAASVIAQSSEKCPAVSAMAHISTAVPLIENAKQNVAPQVIADPLGMQRKEFRVRRRK